MWRVGSKGISVITLALLGTCELTHPCSLAQVETAGTAASVPTIQRPATKNATVINVTAAIDLGRSWMPDCTHSSGPVFSGRTISPLRLAQEVSSSPVKRISAVETSE